MTSICDIWQLTKHTQFFFHKIAKKWAIILTEIIF